MQLSQKKFSYPMRRPFYYSLAGHGVFLLVLILLGWLGPKLPARRQYSKPTTVRVISEAKPTPAPERETPKPAPERTRTPKPTPKRTATPRPKTPRPTAKPTPSTRKTMSVSKETVTPTPTPKNERPTPVPIKHDSRKKEVVKTPPPTPSPSPSPSPSASPTPRKTPDLKTPKPELKETTPPTPGPTPPPVTPPPLPENTPYAGSRTQNTDAPSFKVADDNVNLPDSYMLDAANRLQQNFKVPRNAQSSVKSCVISFRVKSDGTIYDIKIERSTNISGLDYIARRAVSETGSLLPISEYTDRSDIKATVRFVFGSSD